MIFTRKSAERGQSLYDWLRSFHTFSFADYYDPQFMGFSSLRVINEDTVAPGMGFGRHAHRDMEIISYVIGGAIQHEDSLGTGSIIKPNEIQRMSAGTGVQHSEFNPSKSEALHFLQIWILPEAAGLTPSYEQKPIRSDKNTWILIGSRDGKEGVTIHQDASLYVAHLEADQELTYDFKNDRRGWLQMVKGAIILQDQELEAGDGAAVMNEKKIRIRAKTNAEFLWFDLE